MDPKKLIKSVGPYGLEPNKLTKIDKKRGALQPGAQLVDKMRGTRIKSVGPYSLEAN